VLFRAIGIPVEMSGEADPDHLEDILRSRAHAQLDQLASAVRPELIERCSVELGTTAAKVVNHADRNGLVARMAL
jgi:hypothetical protein